MNHAKNLKIQFPFLKDIFVSQLVFSELTVLKIETNSLSLIKSVFTELVPGLKPQEKLFLK